MQPYMQLTDNLRLRQCRHGLMVCLTTDHYIGKALDQYGEFSEGEIAAFQQIVKPSDVVLDIGANHGSHTVFLAQHAKFVHAFEPQPFMHRILCANITLNGLVNVRTYQAGVGNGREFAKLHVPTLDYTRPGNFGSTALRRDAIGESVPILDLDSLNLPQCDFIKIDAEGMELQVLQGACATIHRCQPNIYLENDRADKSEMLISHLLNLNYRLFWHLPTYFNSDNFYKNTNNLYPRQISINMLAILHGSTPEISGLIPITDAQDTWQKALKRQSEEIT